MDSLTVSSPAKINLFLKVVGRRTNGYHDLQTLICRVNLCDNVILSFNRTSITARCNHPDVPDGKENLAHKAATLFLETLPIRGGVDIFIEKNIPVAAGLGGGSSNAATVLMALNQHHGFPFVDKELMDLGLKIGADVPFFILQHTAFVTGIGQFLEAFKGMLPFWTVLVHPRLSISTAWVYEHLNLGLTNCEGNYSVSRFLEDLPRFKGLLCNDLEQVTAKKFPEICSIKKALLDQGADGALMSGSGPTVFGLFQSHSRAFLAYTAMRHQQRWDVYLADLLAP